MKKFNIIISLIAGLAFSMSYSTDICRAQKPGHLLIVSASSGLRMRKGPGLNHDKVLTIPANGLVQVKKIGLTKETIGKASGYWVEVTWNNETGWVFSGYLRKAPIWVKQLEGFWMSGQGHNGNGMALDNVAPGSNGAFMGCPGGIGPFTIITSIVEKKSVQCQILLEDLYEGGGQEHQEMNIDFISSTEIKVSNETYRKAKKSDCFDQ